MAANGTSSHEPAATEAAALSHEPGTSSHEPGTSSHEPAKRSNESPEGGTTVKSKARLADPPQAETAQEESLEDASDSEMREFDPEIDCIWTIAGVHCSTYEYATEILVCARWERLVCQATRRSQGTGRSGPH